MKKFVLIPDSFKGTLSSKQICNIMAEKIDEQFVGAKIISIPVADGGEDSRYRNGGSGRRYDGGV